MGLVDFIKKQFIDVIEWTESTDGVLAWRYPFEDREIQNGATLVVRESQMALLVNEGKVAADQARTAMLTALQREATSEAPAEESAN